MLYYGYFGNVYGTNLRPYRPQAPNSKALSPGSLTRYGRELIVPIVRSWHHAASADSFALSA